MGNGSDEWLTADAALDLVQPSEPIEWSDFGQASFSKLQKLREAAALDVWWTWPEAIAWIGRRDLQAVAALRFWGTDWWGRGGGNNDPTHILRAQADIARRYCVSANEAEADLLNAIQWGQVGTSGRLSKGVVASDLPPNIWRGGSVDFQWGEAVLVDAKNKFTLWAFDIAIRRPDLFDAFGAGDSNPELPERHPKVPSRDAAHFLPDGSLTNCADVFARTAWLSRDVKAIFRGDQLPYNSDAERIANGQAARLAHVETLAGFLRSGGLCHEFLSETLHYHGGSPHGLALHLALAFSDGGGSLAATQCWAMLMHWRGTPNEPFPEQPVLDGANLSPANVAINELPTGDPGRPPKGWHIYSAEHARRCASDEAHEALADEARHLLKWYKATYPKAPPPGVDTIQNRIRAQHSQHRGHKIK